MLRVSITDLTGDLVAQPQQFSDATVTIPFSAPRTASVRLSVYDPAAAQVRPLDRMLRIEYRYATDVGRILTRLVFWGPITVPEWNGEEGTVTVNAHDATLRLKHSYLNHSDTAIFPVGPSGGTMSKGVVRLDGTGARLLLHAGDEPSGAFPALGIIDGWNTHPGAPLMSNGQPQSMPVERGDEIAQKIDDLRKLAPGPDVEFEPYDGQSDFPGAAGQASATGPVAIPDYDGTADVGGHVEVPIVVSGVTSVVGRMLVRLHITHTWIGDLVIWLRHPDGTTIKLIDNRGGSKDDMGVDCSPAGALVFDDEADPVPATPALPAGPLRGNYQPQQALSAFRYKPPNGTWTLIVEDWGTGDTGSIQCVTLDFAGRGTRIPGVYARMHTWQKEDNGVVPPPAGWSQRRLQYKGKPDKRDTVIFHYGFGHQNVVEFTHSPGGDRVLNYYVAVTENTDGSRPGNRGIRQAYNSRVAYGTYMGWQAAGQEVSAAVNPAEALEEIARQYVTAYGFPPAFVTFKPAMTPVPGVTDPAQIFYYLRDFHVGDTVLVLARKGHMEVVADAWVKQVTLTQADLAGNMVTEVEAVPLDQDTVTDPGDSP